ncbi:sodium:solute symporter family transporter [Brevibacillus fluminis]|uniref:sodium:solute symporter family transporter n=1 Tax=Brevibacillus fluminis TaxID=511487 RepID=UPI003F89674F
MFYHSFREYVLGTAKVGIGLGVVSILARWITGNTIFASPEALVRYGIFGGIGYALMVAFGLIAFGWLGKRVRQEFSEGLTIGDYLRFKLNRSGYWMLIGVLFVISFETMFMQGLAAGVLVNILFGIPIPIGLLCFFLLCVLYAGFGGIVLIHRFAFIQVIFTFAAAILIPVYFFIEKGVEHVYAGIRLYHPYLLVANNHEGLLFIVCGLLIGFGQVFVDQASWQRLYMIEEKKIVPAFLLSGLIGATVPLAFSALIMIVIFTGGFHDIYSLLFGLIRKIDNPFLLVLFVLCSFSAITSAFGAGIHSMISLMVSNVYQLFKPQADERQKLRMSYLLAIVLGVLSFLVTVYFTPSLLELLFFFGIIYAALLIPVVVMVLAKGKVSTFIPFSALVGMAFGYVSRSFVGNLEAIWISTAASTTLVLLYLCSKAVGKHFAHE